MATYSTQKAKASWQGNYDTYGVGPGDGVRLVAIEVELTAAQIASGNIVNLLRLTPNTAVLGGWIKTDVLDAHATPTLDLDVGYYCDTVTDDPNFFYEGGGAAASRNANFIAGIGAAAAPFVNTEDTTIAVTFTANAATAQAGTIYVYLLLGCVDSVNEAVV